MTFLLVIGFARFGIEHLKQSVNFAFKTRVRFNGHSLVSNLACHVPDANIALRYRSTPERRRKV